MPERKFSAGASYRYGFNGKEDDKDISAQDYGMRIYNPRIGKFLSVDPISNEYPWYTPYQFAGNTPIQATDLDGLEPMGYHKNDPYVKLHPGSGVTPIGSEYDNEGFVVKIDSRPRQLMNVYAIQDIDKKTYLIFETINGGPKQQWYLGYEKGRFNGEPKRFDWQRPPNPANTLTAITVIPLVAGPAAVELNPWALWRLYKIAKERQRDFANQKLVDKGNQPDKNGLTRLGRALQKHSSREGSVYDKPSRTRNDDYNAAGEKELRRILEAEGRAEKTNRNGGIDYTDPSTGKGARFDKDGNFSGFLEPSKRAVNQ